MDCISVACINEVMNTKADNVPVPGMPATMFVGSDRYPMIVLEVKTPKRVLVAHMNNEDYKAYKNNEEDFNGEERLVKYRDSNYEYSGTIYTKRKNGRWLPQGSGLWETCSIRFGYADEYMDPSF